MTEYLLRNLFIDLPSFPLIDLVIIINISIYICSQSLQLIMKRLKNVSEKFSEYTSDYLCSSVLPFSLTMLHLEMFLCWSSRTTQLIHKDAMDCGYFRFIIQWRVEVAMQMSMSLRTLNHSRHGTVWEEPNV